VLVDDGLFGLGGKRGKGRRWRGEWDVYASAAIEGPGASRASAAVSIGRERISSSSIEIRGISEYPFLFCARRRGDGVINLKL
jgi:hypothetical protein